MCTTSGRSAVKVLQVCHNSDLLDNASHRRLGNIRRIGHRNQLGTGASQDSAGVMLSMTPGAEERYAEGTRS
jgi:hypothetical protein